MKELLKDEEKDLKKKSEPQISFHPVFLAQDKE